jgi:hypothetical protein
MATAHKRHATQVVLLHHPQAGGTWLMSLSYGLFIRLFNLCNRVFGHAEPLPPRPPSSKGGSPAGGGSPLRVRAFATAEGSPTKPTKPAAPLATALSTAVSAEALLDGIRM